MTVFSAAQEFDEPSTPLVIPPPPPPRSSASSPFRHRTQQQGGSTDPPPLQTLALPDVDDDDTTSSLDPEIQSYQILGWEEGAAAHQPPDYEPDNAPLHH